jgi:hypothetical protein
VLDDEGEVRTNTNVKLTRRDDVARAFSPRLLIDTR